ncbi:DNA polymerase III subunit delta' [Streptococcus sp. CSL10205-OR2]|uniref:DNA polymerase III subunit delta' n=1 Tax=Streptococcus sp. CSL10205-OR2 TaxID=2980558 RepID=UPI0021DA72A6|nr:DNA polymerase III subunit delta' [Streptococcus sp. CSL10205-OR2]MCU9534345.1 DNA polymerase III subunit delta' [Streptococcus sp. CSL10205-OR2]
MNLEQQQPKIFAYFNTILKEQRLSHAYLFSGEFASFEMAIYVAKSLFCTNLSKDNQPCLICRSCQLIDEREFLDLKIIEPTGNTIKTETVRDFIHDFSFSGIEGKRQVFIIKEAEKMHLNAANSLLKFIENPQKDVYIILITSDANKILPTIRSRCQVFYFKKDHNYIKDYLESLGVLPSQAMKLAELVSTISEAEKLSKNQKWLDNMREIELVVSALLANQPQVYLRMAKLSEKIQEKDEQLMTFKLMVYLASEVDDLFKKDALLKKIYQAQKMWQANVSFQNALEFMALAD